MKISKSKQELARIISENGGWRECAGWSVFGKKSMAVVFVDESNKKPIYSLIEKAWPIIRNSIVGEFGCQPFPSWRQTILSRAEYFHLYPAPDADGWIEWEGGEPPVDGGTYVDVKLASGREYKKQFIFAGSWRHCNGEFNVLAYRLHKPEQAEHEFCESVMRSIPEPEYKPSIEQLMQTYADRAHSVQLANEHLATCTKQANEAMEALSVACEAAGFDISPITEKQEPNLVITDWRDLIGGDVICVDSVEASDDIRDALQGVESVVVTDRYMTGCVTNENYPNGESWCLGGPAETKWRFIRRP